MNILSKYSFILDWVQIVQCLPFQGLMNVKCLVIWDNFKYLMEIPWSEVFWKRWPWQKLGKALLIFSISFCLNNSIWIVNSLSFVRQGQRSTTMFQPVISFSRFMKKMHILYYMFILNEETSGYHTGKINMCGVTFGDVKI